MPDRGSSRQGRSVQDSAGLQDRGAGSESLARHAHIRAPLRGDADLDGVGRLSDARRVVRVLDFHDSVGALGDRRARHDAPGLPPLEAVLAGVARRNVARDGQSPGALALQVIAAHRKPVHRGIRKRRQGNQRQDINRQAATQAFLDGKRVVGEDVAERQRLDQFAMLRGRQGGIVHVTSVGPGAVGEACGGMCAQGVVGLLVGPLGVAVCLAPAARGVGRVGRWRLVSTAWTWEAGGNCTTWGFDTPATRRDGTSSAAKPPLAWPGGPSLAQWIQPLTVFAGCRGLTPGARRVRRGPAQRARPDDRGRASRRG